MHTARALLASALGLALAASHAACEPRFSTLYNASEWHPTGLTTAGGVLYGAAQGTGSNPTGCGTVFELRAPSDAGGAWTETAIYSFTGTGGDVCNPIFAPAGWASGSLYGLAYEGGAYGLFGGLYDLEPPAAPGGAWSENVAYSFGGPGSAGPAVSALIPGPGGSFYVLTSGGANGWGALFQMQPPAQPGAWTGDVLYSLVAPPGALPGPPESLVMGLGGAFYGTAAAGGTAPRELGTAFQLTPPSAPGGAWTQTVLYNFGSGSGEGSTPNTLTITSDGAIYGTTYGTNIWTRGDGTVFALTPPTSPGGAWGYATLVNFGNDRHPASPLVLRDGDLYGAFLDAQGGAVFELQPPPAPGGAWTTTYLHEFTNYQQPVGNLVMDEAGTIFGVTAAAPGQPPSGTVYAITTE